MVPPHAVDTKQPAVVAKHVKAAFAGIGAESSFPLIDRLFADVTGMFDDWMGLNELRVPSTMPILFALAISAPWVPKDADGLNL